MFSLPNSSIVVHHTQLFIHFTLCHYGSIIVSVGVDLSYQWPLQRLHYPVNYSLTVFKKIYIRIYLLLFTRKISFPLYYLINIDISF
jgi:hypothetical protein